MPEWTHKPLVCEKVASGYGGSPILQKVSLSVGASEIVGLIGANGAGKSTFDQDNPRRGGAAYREVVPRAVPMDEGHVEKCFFTPGGDTGMAGEAIFSHPFVLVALRSGAYDWVV